MLDQLRIGSVEHPLVLGQLLEQVVYVAQGCSIVPFVGENRAEDMASS
ncbi:hypothetical protein [Streptomyces sp. 4N124]